MKTPFILLGGIFLALAAMMVFEAKRQRPVAELAHELELAWADHHTVV